MVCELSGTRLTITAEMNRVSIRTLLYFGPCVIVNIREKLDV